MSLQDKVAKFAKSAYRRYPKAIGPFWKPWGIEPFESSGFPPAKNSRMQQLVAAHSGRLLHKWGHYLEIYDRHLTPFHDLQKPRILEIGVSHGGGLQILRKFFGPDAVIFGVDVDPRCATGLDETVPVRIGSQDNPAFLCNVVEEMGGIDVVIDDGSHVASHQIVSFRTLFPKLNNGGAYIVEDLHCSYWPGEHEGGFGRKETFIETAKSLIDHIHHWYHTRKPPFDWMKSVSAVHFYDSIVVVEKSERQMPRHAKVGTPAF